MPNIISILEEKYFFDKKDPTSMLATIARMDEMLCAKEKEDEEEDAAEGETEAPEEEPTGSVSSFQLMAASEI